MNLEDHLGDVIRKGRTAANVSAETAARAAGLTEAELNALGGIRQGKTQTHSGAGGGRSGCMRGKLEGIAKGWLPAEKNLSAWIELRLIQTEKDGMVVNSYLVWDEVSRDAAIV